MADAREFGTQELVSARYLVETQEDIAPAVNEPSHRARASRSGLEQAIRCLTTLVPIILIAAAGGLYWLNRDAISSKAGELKGRRSVVDLVLWASGSKQTFNGALSDRLERARRDSARELDKMQPAFKTEFQNIDAKTMSEKWNGARIDLRPSTHGK